MNRDNSGNAIDLTLVGKCPLLSDYKKEEMIRSRSMNVINCFGARGYSVRCIHVPIVLLM